MTSIQTPDLDRPFVPVEDPYYHPNPLLTTSRQRQLDPEAVAWRTPDNARLGVFSYRLREWRLLIWPKRR